MTNKSNTKQRYKYKNIPEIILFIGILSIVSTIIFFTFAWDLAPYCFHDEIQTGTVENITEESHFEGGITAKSVRSYVFHIDDGRSLQRIPAPDGGTRKTCDGRVPVINPEWHRTDENWTDENTFWTASANTNWEWVRIHEPTGRVVSTAKQEWESIIRAIDAQANKRMNDGIKKARRAAIVPTWLQKEEDEEEKQQKRAVQELRKKAEDYVTKPQTTSVGLQIEGSGNMSNYEHLIGKKIEYKKHGYFYQAYYTTSIHTLTEEFVEIKHNGKVIYSNPKKQQFINYIIMAILCLFIGVWSIRKLKIVEKEGEIKKAAEDKKAAEQEKYQKLRNLYKYINNQLHYWRVWKKDEETAMFYSGIVGKRGYEKKLKIAPDSDYEEIFRLEIDKKLEEGYAPFDESEKVYIYVVCKTDRLQTPREGSEEETYHEKLNNRLEELLMQTGLGAVISASTGLEFNNGVVGFNKSAPIDIYCEVIDLDIAKEVIENDLKRTEFYNHQIINADEYEE